MEVQQDGKELHPNSYVTWMGKRYGVSDPTDPEEVGEFWVTTVTDSQGLEVLLVDASAEAFDLGFRLTKELPMDRIKALPYVHVTGESD